MRNATRIFLTSATVLVVTACSGASARVASERPECEEGIEVAGICDPYVPGTIIRFRPGQPILVVSTWHDGPAEKAGVCPGDEILSVNNIPAAENPTSRMLKEIASESPSLITLRVKRGPEELVFDVPRVRESTLAKLSRQKFLKADGVVGTRLVPLEQSHDEMKQLEKFQERIERAQGFKTVDGLLVPLATRDEQIKRLSSLRQSDRIRGVVGFSNEPDSYSAGFFVVVLTAPEEVWIYNVSPGSPAHRAGLLPGDKLEQLDGKSTEGLAEKELKNLLLTPDEPRRINLTVMRAGSEVSVALDTQKAGDFALADFDALVPEWGHPSASDYILGVHALRAEDSRREAIVADLEYPSPAFDAGLHVGDLILEVNGIPIQRIDRKELGKVLSPKGPSEVVLEVSRLGKKMTFRLTPITYRAALATIGRKPTRLGPTPTHCPESP